MTARKTLKNADRRHAITHLGRDVVRLVRGYPAWQTTAEGHFQFGLMLDRMLRASVKAGVEGRQTTAQIAAKLDAARKAANRSLARSVASTMPLRLS